MPYHTLPSRTIPYHPKSFQTTPKKQKHPPPSHIIPYSYHEYHIIYCRIISYIIISYLTMTYHTLPYRTTPHHTMRRASLTRSTPHFSCFIPMLHCFLFSPKSITAQETSKKIPKPESAYRRPRSASFWGDRKGRRKQQAGTVGGRDTYLKERHVYHHRRRYA